MGNVWKDSTVIREKMRTTFLLLKYPVLVVNQYRLDYEANPECNSKQKRHAAGQLVNMKTLFDSHSPTHKMK